MDAKYNVETDENKSFSIAIENGKLLLDGEPIALDVVKTSEKEWHLLHNNISYNIKLVAFDAIKKEVALSVNDKIFTTKIKTELDVLLSKMGMNSGNSHLLSDVKAPMPGLVVEVMVEAGQQIAKNDSLLILEAMKMENVIKATGDGIVKNVLVKNKDTVEKNQILIEME